MSEICVKLEGITKTFGTVTANNNVSLSVNKSEIHALLGENGSGKSTLMNILSGIYSPDSGTVELNGEKVVFKSPKDSLNSAIGMVHQHFKLVEVLSARDNIIAGNGKGLFIQRKNLTKKINDICSLYGLSVNPDKKVYNMSVSEKQTVEIVKVLFRGAKILILDEPTAVLTPQETSLLFDILRKMKAKGCSIIIITHKLNEVLEISDRVTILRKGETVGTIETAKTNAHELTELMVGHPVSLDIKRSLPDSRLVKKFSK